MKEEKRPYHDGLSFPSANVPGITPESAFTDGYQTALHNMDNTGSADSVNIDEDGKASDMDDQSVMSGDGCNPVNKDSEMNRAHDDDAGWIFPIHSTAKDIFKFILTVKSNIAGEYQKKKENIRHYLKEMKSVKEMANEYARIYNKTINTFPVLAYDTNDTQSKIEFYKKSRELNPSSIKSIQEKKEYKRIKNIIKGSAPFKRAFREMKLYRETYKNSKWRNKILFNRIICLNTCSTFTKKYY